MYSVSWFSHDKAVIKAFFPAGKFQGFLTNSSHKNKRGTPPHPFSACEALIGRWGSRPGEIIEYNFCWKLQHTQYRVIIME